jgi:hypothetical protein
MITNRHGKRSAARNTTSAVNASPKILCSRILVILLAFVALTVQALVVQSHIHIPQAASKLQSASLVSFAASASTADTRAENSANAPRDKYPLNQDPSNCPLCQEFGHSGQFVASTSVLFSLPCSLVLAFFIVSETIPTFFAVSHSWQGRAPPQR